MIRVFGNIGKNGDILLAIDQLTLVGMNTGSRRRSKNKLREITMGIGPI